MKTPLLHRHNQNNSYASHRKCLGAALAAFVLTVCGAPFAVNGEEEKVKIKGEDTKIKIKGEGADALAEKMLSPEVVATFTPGYTIPAEYRVALGPMPALTPEVELRYYGNTVYYIDPKTYRILDVVTTASVVPDPHAAVVRSSGAVTIITPEVQRDFIKGYVVPEKYRKELRVLPAPPAKAVLRFYGSSVYYLHPETYEILRVVPLGHS